jgi:hypothetical protein
MKNCCTLILVFVVIISTGFGEKKGFAQDLKPKKVPPGFSYPVTGPTGEYPRPFVVRWLSGKITGPEGLGLPQVLVERMSADWKTRLDAVFTDESGNFRFAKSTCGRYPIRLSLSGYGPVEVTLLVKRSAKSIFHFELDFAN